MPKIRSISPRPPRVRTSPPSPWGASDIVNGSVPTCCMRENISLSFGGVHAVAGVDITVHEREIYAIIGPNGAGKTSFFNALSGYFFPDAGSVTFQGQDITRAPNYKRVQLGMSRTFQTPSVFPELTVEENLLVGVHSQMSIAGRVRVLGKSQRAAVDESRRRVAGVRQSPASQASQVASLSHGSQRFVEIATCLSVAGTDLARRTDGRLGGSRHRARDGSRARFARASRSHGRVRGTQHAVRLGARAHGDGDEPGTVLKGGPTAEVLSDTRRA